MPLESAADRAVFLNAEEFGASATMPDEDPVVSFSGVLDEDAEVSLERMGSGVQTVQPIFTVRNSDLPGSSLDGKRILVTHPITGLVINYRIGNIEPDATGMTILHLKEIKNA